ncbi:MAG TPA: SDR family oxidoreductase [Myxococcota bacterium]|nr:SDR family oxidoreductase [Myxococcota bacterium]
MSLVAAVTGSASGIGAAIGARLAGEGARVVGVDLRDADVVADLSTPGGRRAAVEGVLAACGGRLDRFVACAGLNTHVEPMALIPAVNYFGAVELLDGLLPALRVGREPAALAISSNSAQMAPFLETPYVQALLADDEPAAARALADAGNGFLAYAGSKLALAVALRRRAAAWGEAGVRLNAVAPGTTETPLLAATLAHPVWGRHARKLPVPLARFAHPDEIARVVCFLLSPAASFVHGSILYADGGTDAQLRSDRF